MKIIFEEKEYKALYIINKIDDFNHEIYNTKTKEFLKTKKLGGWVYDQYIILENHNYLCADEEWVFGLPFQNKMLLYETEKLFAS